MASESKRKTEDNLKYERKIDKLLQKVTNETSETDKEY